MERIIRRVDNEAMSHGLLDDNIEESMDGRSSCRRLIAIKLQSICSCDSPFWPSVTVHDDDLPFNEEGRVICVRSRSEVTTFDDHDNEVTKRPRTLAAEELASVAPRNLCTQND